jgi:histidinol-phosphate aminotransferase
MALTKNVQHELLNRGYTRRQVARIALGAAAVLPFFHEFAFAQNVGGTARGAALEPDVVRITSNENPMGPSQEGLEAMAKVAPLAWRYGPQGDNQELQTLLARTEGVKPDYVMPYPGSGSPLANLVPAFTSPTRSWVMASPGYGNGASRGIGNKVVQVPLRNDYTHDVEGMIKADPNAGVYYVCNPNNPTGTLTPRKDIAYLLANKKPDAIVVIDEAYIHFHGRDEMATDLVRQDKDVVVLRTFSKLYGMAGMRAGAAYARPDLLKQLAKFGRVANIAVTTMACAAASLKAEAKLIQERSALNTRNRDLAMEGISKLAGAAAIPSVSNFFMLSVKGMTGPQINKAMAAKKILLAGHRWPEWPNHVRVTVGTTEEMAKFNAALAQVVQEGPLKATA